MGKENFGCFESSRHEVLTFSILVSNYCNVKVEDTALPAEATQAGFAKAMSRNQRRNELILPTRVVAVPICHCEKSWEPVSRQGCCPF